MNPNPSRTAGYSMLELLVVLAIMSLILVVAIPAASGTLQRLSLSSDARLVASNLRNLREQAADQQSEITITAPPGRAGVLSVSNGSEILLAWGTTAQILSRNDRSQSLRLSWDGSVSGSVMLTRSGSTIRISADRVTGRLILEGAP